MRTFHPRNLLLPLLALCLAGGAFAQIPADPDPAKNVIDVTIRRDGDPVVGPLAVNCHEIVSLDAIWTDPQFPGFSNYWFEWRDADGNALTILDSALAFEAEASQTYKFIVYHQDTGFWGEASITVTAEDNTAPTIWLNGQATYFVNCGGTFSDLGAQASDDCDDNVSITVAGAVNTHAVGSYVLTYTATDSSGNSASVDRTVNVVYPWSGFLEPVDSDGRSVFRLGSIMPLKFQITCSCCGGENIVARLYLAKVNGAILGTEVAAETVGNADTGNVFRYVNGTYHYNLNTKGLSEGTWQIRVDLGDGAIHAVQVSLAK